jgi:hypothetical protein
MLTSVLRTLSKIFIKKEMINRMLTLKNFNYKIPTDTQLNSEILKCSP